MTTIETSRTVATNAPALFETISTPERYAEIVPQIDRIEMLGDLHSGVGTRFCETRTMKGKHATVELVVTRYDPPRLLTIESDSGGILWISDFTVEPQGGDASHLHLTMECRPKGIAGRLMLPLIKGMVTQGLNDDMDAILNHFQSQS